MGNTKQETFDFGMLIPAFSGHGFQGYDKDGQNITEKLFRGFMVVDADYTQDLTKNGPFKIGQKRIKTQAIKIFLHLELLSHHHIPFQNLEKKQKRN